MGAGHLKWRGFGDVTTMVVRAPVGSVVVEIFDGKTRKLVWRRSATDVPSETPDTNEKRLENSIEHMFKKFPPSR